MATKTIEPQIFQAVVIEDKYEAGGEQAEIEESELDEEVHYWCDEFEANKKKLSRAFVKHLRSGKFVLSSDRKYLIDKETGQRYIDFVPNYIVEIATASTKK